MSRHTNERPHARATVLLASDSGIFLDILSDMVGDCGFTPATPAPAEPPWLSVTRTQPAFVICDCGGLGARLKPLIAETVARGLPLLLASAAHDRDVSQRWVLPPRVAWLAFPIDGAAFRALIDDLMTPTHGLRRTAALSVGGLSLDVGLTTRTLVDVATELSAPAPAARDARVTLPPRRSAMHGGPSR